MEFIRRLFAKTVVYHRLSEKSSLLTFGTFANNTTNMIVNSPDHSKKSSVLEKLGQKISTFKDDIADNLERRKQIQNKFIQNQIHYINHTNQSEDSLVIEKKPSAPIEIRQRLPSGDENLLTERSYSASQLTLNAGKKTTNESSTPVKTESFLSNSFQDIFSTENNEQAKEAIINDIRYGMNRSYSGALSESGSDDSVIKKPDTVDGAAAAAAAAAVINNDKSKRKATMLLAGPRFRHHVIESENNLQRDTIYPVSIVVGITSIIIILWKPISPLISGFILGFLCASAMAYIIIRMYLDAKAEENNPYEYIDFPELDAVVNEKINKIDKYKTSPTCCELVFGRYDSDRDDQFIRYPVVIHFDNDRLIIKLAAKAKSEEKKDKEIKFVGHLEYLLKDAKLMLVPEGTLGRVKYWINEYPIVIQNMQLHDKQSYEKSKLYPDDLLNSAPTTLSFFFETGPDKEDWFYRLLFVIRKKDEETENGHPSLINTSSYPQMSPSSITPSASDTHISTLSSRTPSKQSNFNSVENRLRKKSIETNASPYFDTISLEKHPTDLSRSQMNDIDTSSDMTQARIGAQELRADMLEKDKKVNDKDSDKDSNGTQQRTGSIKKKFRKQEENLQRILTSPDCLNEAAITLNFLERRLFCDVFRESLFKDLLKEKLELKLKELAVSVLEDLHIETIDMGNTLPVILKVEPMQWNTKGLWLNLFVCYRGSFKVTIRTRIFLQRLLNNNSTEQPIHYQHRSGQILYKEDERIDNDEPAQRQKLSTKDPDILENAAARKLGSLLTKVAGNKHVQRIAALKPVAGVLEKLSNADVGANIELINLNGIMTINIPPPPSDRIWIGFSEMPDLNLKVTPVFGESKYSYTLIHDFLESQIRDEIRRSLVFPAMDDQLLPFFRDWVFETISSIATKSSNKELLV